jgi:hypothetical protein
MKLVLALALILASGLAHATAPTTLSIVTVSDTAAAFADGAADTGNGNQIKNSMCDVVLLLHNSHASSSSTVTVVAQGTSVDIPGFGLMTKANASITLAAGAKKVIGPLRCRTWNDSSGYVQLTYSGSGTVLVSPIRVPQ